MKLFGVALCLLTFSGFGYGQGVTQKKPTLVKVPPPMAKAQRAATLSNLKQTGIATMILLSDYDDLFPYVQSTSQLFKFLMPYTKNEKLFKTLNPAGGAFQFNMCIAGTSATAVEKPSETPLFYETKSWPDGSRGVVFTDAHAKFVTKEEWNKMQPLLKLKMKRHGKPIPLNAKTLGSPPPIKN